MMSGRDIFQEFSFGGRDAVPLITDVLDVNICDSRSKTKGSLLHIAVAYNNIFAFNELLRRGGNVNIENSIGQTPLHYAAIYNHTEMGEKLIAKGAEVGHLDSRNITPVFEAVLWSKGKHYDMVQLLAEHGGSKYLDIHNRAGITARELVNIDPRLQEIFESAAARHCSDGGG